MSPRTTDAVFFVALLASALSLGPALAHAFELPNKIGLTREAYFIVQQIYRGWSLLGLLLVVQLAALATAAILERRQRRALMPVLVSILLVLAAQAVFWAFTYPANVATRNWAVPPEDWMKLRRQWEYSHAAGAALQLLAMASLIVATLRRT